MLGAGELIVAPGIFDGVSAHLVRRMGFRAGYLTGAGIAASGFALPDVGLVGMAEMVDRVAMVTGVLGEIPLIADADTGYGPPASVARTVRAYERAGAAAIQLEDQAFPKRCGHLAGKRIVTAEAFLAQLGAALDARAGRADHRAHRRPGGRRTGRGDRAGQHLRRGRRGRDLHRGAAKPWTRSPASVARSPHRS